MTENNVKFDFLQHIKHVSEKVDKWPEWKKGEYVNVYEQWADEQAAREKTECNTKLVKPNKIVILTRRITRWLRTMV